jgi:flagellar basal-body rod protein FlgG
MAIISLHSAASALSALNTSLDVTANNLANANTPGFKPSRANFQDLLYVERMQPGIESGTSGERRPIGLYVGLGTQVTGTQMEFKQGSPIETGRPLDLTINGDSFFKVTAPEVPGGFAYTRAGHFTQNAEGQVVLADNVGRRIDPEITFPQGATGITVTPDGRVTYSDGVSTTPIELTRITLSMFINPSGLKSLGGNLFAPTAASGPAVDGQPETENFGSLLQGFIEGSAVDPTRELIDLIKTQRAFEMNSNTIRTADETLRTVAQLKR